MSTDPQSYAWSVASALADLRAVAGAADRALERLLRMREDLEDLGAAYAGIRIHRYRRKGATAVTLSSAIASCLVAVVFVVLI
jgi:hypothetical protein